MQALIHGLAREESLQAALPVLDAWLQQQEDALAEDANTQGPLQVGRPGCMLWCMQWRVALEAGLDKERPVGSCFPFFLNNVMLVFAAWPHCPPCCR